MRIGCNYDGVYFGGECKLCHFKCHLLYRSTIAPPHRVLIILLVGFPSSSTLPYQMIHNLYLNGEIRISEYRISGKILKYKLEYILKYISSYQKYAQCCYTYTKVINFILFYLYYFHKI